MGVLYDELSTFVSEFDISTLVERLPTTVYNLTHDPWTINVAGVKVQLLSLVNYCVMCCLVRNCNFHPLHERRYPVAFPLSSVVNSATMCFSGALVTGLLKGGVLTNIKDVDVMAFLVVW